MKETSLPSIAAEFTILARRFEDHARRAHKPHHLSTNIRQLKIQAGRLLQKAAEAGAFAGDSWWRDGKSPAHPFDDGRGSAIRYESEAEFSSSLWTFAIGSWLAKRFPERFRHNAEEWDWSHVAIDEEGRPLGEDGKPLRAGWYKDGNPLPDGFRLTPECPPGEYKWQLEGRVAKREGFYDEADCMEHLRIRAEVYTDACRLLADVISDVHPSQVSDGADPTKPDATGYVASPSDLRSYVPLERIRTEYCKNIALTSVKEITKVLVDFSKNRVRWTRPPSKKTSSPHPQRRSVHLADWEEYVRRLDRQRHGAGEDGFLDPTPAEIEAGTRHIRRNRQAGK